MKPRLGYLDGLRGVAAVVVVFEHLAALLPVTNRTGGEGLLSQLAASAMNLPFHAGSLAVYIFFGISGIVISASADARPAWPRILLSRYLRLTVPMVAAGILAWILLNIFPNEMPQVALFQRNHSTTELYQQGGPSLLSAVSDAVWRTYATGRSYADPALWSMQIELYGSLAIYTFYAFVPGRWRTQLLGLIALALVAIQFQRYLAFPLGAILYELNRRNRIKPHAGAMFLALTAAIALPILAETPTVRHLAHKIWGDLVYGPNPPGRALLNSLAGIFLLFFLISSRRLQSILSSRIPHFLGRISYSLYLIHMPLLYSAFTALYLALGKPPHGVVLAAWAFAFGIAVVALAWAMTLFVDEPAARLARLVPNARRSNPTDEAVAAPTHAGLA